MRADKRELFYFSCSDQFRIKTFPLQDQSSDTKEGRCSYLKEDEIEVRVVALPVGEEFCDGGDAAEDVPAAVDRLRDVSDGPAV